MCKQATCRDLVQNQKYVKGVGMLIHYRSLVNPFHMHNASEIALGPSMKNIVSVLPIAVKYRVQNGQQQCIKNTAVDTR